MTTSITAILRQLMEFVVFPASSPTLANGSKIHLVSNINIFIHDYFHHTYSTANDGISGLSSIIAEIVTWVKNSSD